MSKKHYTETATEQAKKSFRPFLSDDEELVIVTGLSHIYLRQQFMVFLIVPGAVFILIGLAVAYFMGWNLWVGISLGTLLDILISVYKMMLTHHAHRYLLTTRRVIVKQGYFSVRVISALYDKITHIEVEQGFTDRVLLNHGKIIINTAGTTKDEMILEYIESPVEFKNILERLINNERQQNGRQPTSLQPIEGEIVG